MISDEELDEWERLANEARKGPWWIEGIVSDEKAVYTGTCSADDPPQRVCDVWGPGDSKAAATAVFIAASHPDRVRELIAEVRELRKAEINSEMAKAKLEDIAVLDAIRRGDFT